MFMLIFSMGKVLWTSLQSSDGGIIWNLSPPTQTLFSDTFYSKISKQFLVSLVSGIWSRFHIIKRPPPCLTVHLLPAFKIELWVFKQTHFWVVVSLETIYSSVFSSAFRDDVLLPHEVCRPCADHNPSLFQVDLLFFKPFFPPTITTSVITRVQRDFTILGKIPKLIFHWWTRG